MLGEPSEPGLLGRSDGRAGPAEPIVEPGFHFDEHQCAALLRNKINLSPPCPVVPFHNPVTPCLQKLCGRTLAFRAEEAAGAHRASVSNSKTGRKLRRC